VLTFNLPLVLLANGQQGIAVPAAWVAICLPVMVQHKLLVKYLTVTWVLLIVVYAQETTAGYSLLGLLG